MQSTPNDTIMECDEETYNILFPPGGDRDVRYYLDLDEYERLSFD